MKTVNVEEREMTDDVRITIALICGAILFVYLFFSVFLEGKTKGNKLMIKAKKDGSTTIGRVVKNDYRRFTGPEGRYRSEIVTYEYFVEGKRFEKKITFTDTGVVVNYPNQIEIFYDKSNPVKAYADVELTQNKQKQTGCYIAIVIPIVAIILIYNLLKLI